MKKLILLLLIAMITLTVSANNISTHKQDGKIVHPTASITNDQAIVIVNKMRGKANDAEKVALIKEEINAQQGYQTTGLTTDQVIMLLNQLNEDPKLEVAIWAFQYTIDYKKYQRIQDLFNTEINKRKLQDYVDKHRK